MKTIKIAKLLNRIHVETGVFRSLLMCPDVVGSLSSSTIISRSRGKVNLKVGGHVWGEQTPLKFSAVSLSSFSAQLTAVALRKTVLSC